MRVWRYSWFCGAIGGLALGMITAAGWAQQGTGSIGVTTAVHGVVSVMHAGVPVPTPLAIHQSIFTKDTIETSGQSKIKALFQDDTILTMGPQTRVEIVEYLHDSDQHVRHMTVKLMHGTVRILVGRAFTGLGSTFVVQAGTTSIIANATYCVVWSNEQGTGVANIGTSGAASFMAGDRRVVLEPGFYAMAQVGKPPSAPEPMKGKTPSATGHAIVETEVKDDIGSSMNELADKEIEEELRACPPGSPPGGICPRTPPPAALSPATPPAVTSGATRR
jgi:ferric-dicitrate binding protein FerR (iron transport regulator)